MSHLSVRKQFLLTFVLLLASGCAGFRENVFSPGVTPPRQKRSSEAIHEFEDRRDAAQLAAALDRSRQGDTARAEAMLAALVNRRPDYIDARLRLAEILWSREDDSAEQHLRAIIQSNPVHAEAHHTLGLLLSATARTSEAHQHLLKAVELEPQNEVFATTYRSQAGGS
jgi:Tfp pilus assembly protein PilF